MTPTRPELDDLLVDYLYDELDPAQRAVFERGLVEHPELAEEVEAHRRTRSVASSLPVATMPAGLLDGVLAEAARVAASSASAKGGASSTPGLFERLFRVFNQPAFAMAMVALVVVGVGMLLLDKPLPGDADPNSQRLAPAPVASVEPAEKNTESEGTQGLTEAKSDGGRHGVAPVAVGSAPEEDAPAGEAEAFGQAAKVLADELAEPPRRSARDGLELGAVSGATERGGAGAGGRAGELEVAKRAPRPRAEREVTRSAPRPLGGVADGFADLGARADEPLVWDAADQAPAEGATAGGEAGDKIAEGGTRSPDESNYAKPAADRAEEEVRERVTSERAGAQPERAARPAPTRSPRDEARREATSGAQPNTPSPPPSAPSAPPSGPKDAREAEDRARVAPADDDSAGEEQEERFDEDDRASGEAERLAALWRRYAEHVAAERWSDAEEVLEQLERVPGQRERVRTSRSSLASRRQAVERKATDTKEGVLKPASKPGL